MNYFKLLVLLQRGDRSDFEIPVSIQRPFLFSLKEPNNDVDRSYNQYLCQNFYVPHWKQMCLNTLAALGFPMAISYYLLKRIFVRRNKKIPVMIENKGMEEVVPEIVREKYNPSTSGYNEGTSLSFRDVLFLSKLVYKAPLQPYFAFKAMMNVARYSGMIKTHAPETMIQFGEFSFSGSILTAYCHTHNIKHINIMHGDKIYCIKDSFFHYDECYVWSVFYSELFLSLRAFPKQFVVALPPSMVIETKKYYKKESFADYKYYLGIFNEVEIKQIVDSMSFALKQGKSIKYRPHPRYSDVSLLRKYVKADDIELPNDVSILESISSSNFVVGLYSTVLCQAYYSGKHVIMDDVTYRELYDKLSDFQYFMASVIEDKLSYYQV